MVDDAADLQAGELLFGDGTDEVSDGLRESLVRAAKICAGTFRVVVVVPHVNRSEDPALLQRRAKRIAEVFSAAEELSSVAVHVAVQAEDPDPGRQVEILAA